MFKVFKNANVFTPENIGKKDVLVVNDTIVAIEDMIPELPFDTEVIDLKGMSLVPGFVDQHVHITGGGGEGSFSTRVPEVMLSELTRYGVTTVVGVGGTDDVTRSMPNLLAKARGLEEEGLSTWIYSGAYPAKGPRFTDNFRTDIMFIDKVVGGKVAMSDHRSSMPTTEDYAKLVAETRMGGMMSGKAGVLHIHIGLGKRMLDQIFDILENTEIPASNFTPTHLNRNPELLAQAIKLGKMGACIDFTARMNMPMTEVVKACMDAGLSLDKITMSSDGNGSMPKFNDKGEYIGLTAATTDGLLLEIQDLVSSKTLSLGDALRFITVNPARNLKLPKKGEIKIGNHADFVVLDENLNIVHVMAKGRMMIKDKEILVKGTFEK